MAGPAHPRTRTGNFGKAGSVRSARRKSNKNYQNQMHSADPVAGSVRVVLGRSLSPVSGESRRKGQKCRDRHEARPLGLEKRARVRRGRDCPMIVDHHLVVAAVRFGAKEAINRGLSFAGHVPPVGIRVQSRDEMVTRNPRGLVVGQHIVEHRAFGGNQVKSTDQLLIA